jgi:hypothetical protein
MSEVDQLLNIINSVLQSEDKNARDLAEQTLVSLRTSKPNELLLTFLYILAGISNSYFRSIFSCSKKFFSIPTKT